MIRSISESSGVSLSRFDQRIFHGSGIARRWSAFILTERWSMPGRCIQGRRRPRILVQTT